MFLHYFEFEIFNGSRNRTYLHQKSFLILHEVTGSDPIAESTSDILLITCATILISSLFVSVFLPDHSKHPDPPSLQGSLRPASARRSSASWTPTCSARTPRARWDSRPTGRTCMSRRRTAPPAYQTPRSVTTTASLVWDWPVPPARFRDIPTTTAAGKTMHAWCRVASCPSQNMDSFLL